MDTITPDRIDQSDALTASGSSTPLLPYVAVGGDYEPPEATPKATPPGGGDDTSTDSPTDEATPTATATTSPGLGVLSGAAAAGGGALWHFAACSTPTKATSR